ncbi:hypothetical protein SBA5_250110 [Candidatus Sulfotelmatomonas gaucii]|uniref:Uncharacterized protein n=1 Tax=Candidatus Sulfuritelmatomonas gaucii TaxID=2043161 RepID=A0A2N9L9E5_9BACT|nr:hypothetical protein SBA5_250110 [Candidatus Sulfotelmatomonas gaucii]
MRGHAHQVRGVHQPRDYDCVASGIKSKRHVISLAWYCAVTRNFDTIPASHRERTWSEQFRPPVAFLLQARNRKNAVHKNGSPLFDVGVGWETWITAK